MSGYSIQEDIIYPINQYLAGCITEDELEASDWRDALYELRRIDYWGVRKALTLYYRRLLMGDKAFFRNGSTDTYLKNVLLKSIEREGRYVGRDFNDIDLVKCADGWAAQLMADNHEPRYFFILMQTILMRDFRPDWDAVYENLKKKLANARNFGNFKTHELYCVLMGITMIERTDLSREKKDELVMLLRRHWQFIKYMYSVLIHYIVGLKVENFAAVASSACKKSSHPFMHWFYKAFNENFDVLCPEGLIDPHSGKSVREQALVHKKKMEDIIKSTKPSADLDELFSILFPKVINDVMKQTRPKTYEELEADIDDLSNRYNKVLSQLTNAVRDVETDKISPEDLTAAFLRLPTVLALSYFGTMSALLAMNSTWQKYAPQIQDQILAKQQEQQDRQEQMIEQVERAANKKTNEFKVYPQAGSTANLGCQMQNPEFKVIPPSNGQQPALESKKEGDKNISHLRM